MPRRFLMFLTILLAASRAGGRRFVLATFCVCLLSIGLGAVSAGAQGAAYMGDVQLWEPHATILPLNGLNSEHTGTNLLTLSSLYRWDESSNMFTLLVPQFPAAFKPYTFIPLAAYSNPPGESSPVLSILAVRGRLYSYYADAADFFSVSLPVAVSGPSTLSYRDPSTMVLTTASDQLFVINPNNGSTVQTGSGLFSNVGGTAFGPDGRLYVLDNPNGTYRVQRFNLSSGLVESTFSVAASLASSGNAGMAISSSGQIYMADGLGGATSYDLEGNHLGDFTFTGSGTSDGNGHSYLNIDDAGNIFVYTPGTGLHHYSSVGDVLDTGGANLSAPTLTGTNPMAIKGGGSLTLTGSGSHGKLVHVDPDTTLVISKTASPRSSRNGL